MLQHEATPGAARIDAVAAPRGGLIGMMACPGLASGRFFAAADRASVEADLLSVSRWGAVALVTLMEFEELDSYGIARLPQHATRAGLRHLHLPIADMDVPDAEFERGWRVAGPELRGLLNSGQRIALHCLAGLGRTGTIAARLLIELGMSPESAIRSVRLARPGTIQTIAQERFARACVAQAD